MSETLSGPLHGIRVLDLSRWIAGPFCAMLLADAGAQVTKVERIGGEDARSVPPRLGGLNAYAAHYNRNKRSLELDFRSAEGRTILRRLADESDVVVENFRPGVMEALGLDYATLSAERPQLIMTSISGFGQVGSHRERPGFNTIAEAFCGAMDQTGQADGPPTMSGYFVADHTTGLYATTATLLALHRRGQTGVGQHIDIALADSMFSVLGYSVTAALNGLPIPSRTGNRDNATAPADLFTTEDGQHLYIDAGTDALFAGFCRAIGLDDLPSDPRFATNDDRLKNVDDLHATLADTCRRMPQSNLATRLEHAGIPYSVVNTVVGAVADPYFAERGMVEEVRTADGELIRLPGNPMKMSAESFSAVTPPPMAGQHTDDVLRDMCRLSSDEINDLRRRSVIR
jgi:crotonobetainyl-CoA:carnitine CoA-transferase CaiB-like acyl-CoA transferase